MAARRLSALSHRGGEGAHRRARRLGEDHGGAAGAASRSRRDATPAARSGSAPAARRRSAPTATIRPAFASARRRAVTGARSRSGTSASSGISTTTSSSARATSRWRCGGCASSRVKARHEELDLDQTISGTARKGYLDIHMRPERRNAVKVLMFFDVGGSMDWHIKIAEELFSAARGGVQASRVLLLPQLPLRGRVARQCAALDRARRRPGRCCIPIPPTTR